MYRDASNIQIGNCAIIVDDQTIITYANNQEITYKLIGDKYYKSTASDYSDSYPAGSICYTQDQINTIPSRYDFISPFLYTMAIISAVLIFYGAYKLIIYPWFRRTL